MLEARIQQQFADSADLIYQSAQTLSKPIEAAIHAIVACITNGGKVMACGNGAAAAAAQGFAADFVARLERDRPELAALALSADAAVLTAANQPTQMFARQVRALGQAGDVLLVLSLRGNADSLVEAMLAAHEREMIVVALTGQGEGRLVQLLRDTDVHVGIPHVRVTRVRELQLLALHCICDGVDAQLLGEQELST